MRQPHMYLVKRTLHRLQVIYAPARPRVGKWRPALVSVAVKTLEDIRICRALCSCPSVLEHASSILRLGVDLFRTHLDEYVSSIGRLRA